jgi:biopolymer transport protein ExbD
MNFRPRRKDDLDLNLTPLIDVVFLLLIFFMVSTTFEMKSEINIKLPEAAENRAEVVPDSIVVAIDANGRVFVDDNPLVNTQILTIREAIRHSSQNLDNPSIIINADANATHQSVVRVMDAARQLSLTRITFATRALEQSDADQP